MIKRLVCILFRAVLLPLTWYVNWTTRGSHQHQARFRFCAEFLSLVPFQLGMLARRIYYEQTLAGCGRGLMVFWGAMFLNPGTRVGDDLEVRPFTMIGLADIGDHVSIAQRASLLSGRHQHAVLDGDTEQHRLDAERIHIGSGVWIGSHAVVMNDVGARSTIGAGAVVVDEVPAESVAVGIPARVVRHLATTEQVE